MNHIEYMCNENCVGKDNSSQEGRNHISQSSLRYLVTLVSLHFCLTNGEEDD